MIRFFFDLWVRMLGWVFSSKWFWSLIIASVIVGFAQYVLLQIGTGLLGIITFDGEFLPAIEAFFILALTVLIRFGFGGVINKAVMSFMLLILILAIIFTIIVPLLQGL